MWRENVARLPLWAWAILLTVLSVAFRLMVVSRISMWIDDGASLESIALPLSGQFTERLAAGHFPWYFLALNVWEELFGDSLLALRFPSLLCSLAVLPAVAIIAHRLSDARGALAAMVIFVIHGSLLRHAAELRPYSLYAAEAAWWLAVWVLYRERATAWRAIALGLLHLAILQTHASAPFWILPMYAFAAADLALARGSRREWVGLLAAFLIPILLTIPMVWLIAQHLRPSEYDKFERQVPFSELLSVLSELVMSLGVTTRGFESVLGLATLALLGWLLMIVYRKDDVRWRLVAICAAAVVVAPLTAWLVSITIKPVFGPARYYIAATGPALALLGAALTRWKRPTTGQHWAVAALLLVSVIACVDRAQSRVRNVLLGDGVGLNTAVRGLEQAAPDRALVFVQDSGTTATIARYYMRASTKTFRLEPLSVNLTPDELREFVRTRMVAGEDMYALYYRSRRLGKGAITLDDVLRSDFGPWQSITASRKDEANWVVYRPAK
jgi:uncharacterized membrane protein